MPRLNDRVRPPLRISLTPLIDVVFILLVFFMLASNFQDWRAIPLRASGSGAGGEMRGAVLVEVTAQGLRFAGETVPMLALVDRLRARRADDPDAALLILPRDGVDTGALVDVLDRLARAGLRNLTVVGTGS
ncbi:ExbD/TolR family protein [Roseovarius tibetensis]|uniref:ExbD/TolR family protein n=1 Tax=Roseovarius tibetensis TaxID=2685897 RepID=UPI003D7FB1BC